MKKRSFDVIVIGSGSGLTISSEAIRRGLTTAIIESGPFGGTCLNRGCIPSKMLIHSAEIAETIKYSSLFGVHSKLVKVDWNKIQKRIWNEIDPDAANIEKSNRKAKNVTVYKDIAEFVDKKTLKVGKESITSEKIFICAGARPVVPQIPGLSTVPFVTSDNALRLKKQPRKLIILGGGYIGAELAHFFGELGTEVMVIDRGNMLASNEDEEIAASFTEIFAKKYHLLLNSAVNKVSKKNRLINVEINQNGKTKEITGDVLLVATGRRPNTDILKVENAEIKTNERGFIQVNEYMETNVLGIWSIGDIAGKWMFKHSANLEAEYCAHNAFNPNKRIPVDYTAMPHAVFTSPQIAGVGMTEKQLQDKKITYAVGKYYYAHTGMGRAIEDNDGFVKVLVDPKTKKILGCHILGTEASTLIHEVIVAMKNNLTADAISNAVHIHPALSEVVQRAFNSVEY